MSATFGVQEDGRRCHCCGEAFNRCRETYRGTPASCAALAVMDAVGSLLRLRVEKCNTAANKEVRAGREPHQVLLHKQDRAVYLLESHNAVRAAVAELIEADKAYDEAKAAHRKVRNSPWNGEVRATSEKLTEAWSRRAAALARVGGAA